MTYGSGGGSSGGSSGGGGASTGASTGSSATSERPGQKTNLPLRDPSASFDQRVQDYFNNYFTTPVNVTAQEFDVAKSFFINRTGNEQAAAALTAAVILAANELNIKLVDIIEEYQHSDYQNLCLNNKSKIQKTFSWEKIISDYEQLLTGF